MKYYFFKTLAILSLLFATSCATTSFFMIDVMQPASVNFPENVVNVVVVDNAGAGVDSTNTKGMEFINSISKETFKESLVQFMNEEKYFNEVKLYPHIIRSDEDYGTQIPLSKSDIQQIAKDMDADAVISLDAFETQSTEVLENFSGFLYSAAQANMGILFRISNAQGRLIAPAMLSQDSIVWAGDQGAKYKKEYYIQLALQMSEGMVKQLVPHWESQQRFYYSDGTKLMKEAKKEAKAGNWKEAAKIWGAAYEAASENKVKGKIASNIALANESLDDIDNAVTWIQIASNSLAEHTHTDEYNYTQWYKIQLLQRQQNKNKVLEQLGVAPVEVSE